MQTRDASKQIDVLCGAVILLSLMSAYTCGYDRMIGHSGTLLFRVDMGFLSLQMFFAIAAYQLVRELSGRGGWVEYVVARLARFVPAVVPCVLLSYGLVMGAAIPQLHAGADALLANVLMLADFLGLPDFDGAFWRLKIEVMFAAGLGLVWFGLGARSAIGVLLLGLLLCAWQAHGDPVRQRTVSSFGLLTMDGYLPNLTMGLAIFQLAERRHRALWWLLAAMAGAIVLASNTLAHGGAVLGAYGIVGAAAHGGLPWMVRLAWLAGIGRVFFAIYLVHQALGFVVIHTLEGLGVPAVAAVLVACGAAIAVGAAVHRYFARPAQRIVPRLLAGSGADGAGVAA